MCFKGAFACIITFIFLITGNAAAQNRKPSERDFVFDSLAQKSITGISACVIRENRIVWEGSFGWADAERKIPVTRNTLFMMASVSKTITGAALMHLMEKGAFNLDDDINKYLPFEIRNPDFPGVPVTFRMLLNHSSSLKDNRKYIDSLYVYGDRNEPGLMELISRFYNKNGEYYSRENFSGSRPGEKYLYSNLNYVLIAALIERISGNSFVNYCSENLFKPLEMNDTSWFLKDLDPDRVAFNYAADNRTESGRRKIEHYGWPGYPDGCLRTGMPQFAGFILMLGNKGNFKGRQVLSPKTVSELFTLQNIDISGAAKGIVPVEGMGLTWHYMKYGDTGYFYHTGGGNGITTFAFINPETGNGGVALITGSTFRSNTNKIIEMLLK